jgi:hypothetical protein
MTTPVVTSRWDRAGELAGYAAALALTPYVAIKVSWVAGALLGVLPTGRGLSLLEWVVINTITAAMATAAIVVALALVRPWGLRIPARLVVAGSWLGAGFLVPLLPYTVAGLVAGPDAGDEMPGWEAMLIQSGFVGMGTGLVLALPAYARRRWPAELGGRVGDSPLRIDALVAAGMGAAALLAVLWTSYAVSGGGRDGTERVLSGLFGFWALVAALAMAALVSGRPARLPRSAAVSLAWLGSGSLFAWSAWKLPLTPFVDVSEPWGVHAAGIVAGAAMFRGLVTNRGRR